MNKYLKNLYVVNKDNRTVAFGTNLKDMVEMFAKIEPSARIYQYYYREFKNNSEFQEGEYNFQKIH